VRGSISETGSFGDKQRMVYWRQDGDRIYLDIIAPQGINQNFLKAYLVHPSGLAGAPGFNILNSDVYDINGNSITLVPSLAYFP